MMQFSPILAAAFVTPAFFIAGAALVAIPIVIHILNRRRFKTVPWAAMEFLLRALRKNRRRLQFEQWVLLATRCLVLFLLGMALARPLACSDQGLAGLAQRSGLHVFVIDNSYSMAYEADRPEAKTHLQQAKNLAKAQIDRLAAGGEAVAVITAGAPASAIVARPNYDLDAAKAAVDRIEQSSGATDLAGALQKALEIGREDRQPAKHLYLFTDATRSAWDTPQAQVVAQAGQELATLYRVTHFNLGRGTQWNQALLDVRPASKLVHRFAHDFVADAKGFGNGPDAVLQWKLDDSNLTGGGSLKLDANTPPQTQSQANFKTGGPHVVSATLIGDDRLKIDNARWRVVDVVSELKVLVVEGERGLGTLGGSGAFLALALAPPKEAGDDNPGNRTNSYVAPELISDLELGNKVLPDFGAVVLAGVGSLQPAHADALQKYVQAGGTLMIFMGEGINPDSYNSVLLPRKLMPGALTQRVNVASDQKGYTFDFNPSRDALLHPYLNVFRGEEKSGLNTAQVFSYWRVELPANNGVERVLNYLGPRDDDAGPTTSPGSAATNADPAITAHSLAAGRVVFVSTTANADWTSLPAKPAYLTLMHELLSGSVNAGDAWLNLTVDQPLQIPSTVKLSTAPTLLDPTQKPIVVEPASVEGQTVYRTPPLTQPGVYSLATGAQKYPVAVNVPPQEADVRTLDDAAIKAALGGIELDLQADQLASESVTLDEAGSDLGWSVMVIVLALVGAECFMAMRFGHYRRK